MRAIYKDANGRSVGVGDTVYFSYGTPPVSVYAPIVNQGGMLWVLTPDHRPERCKLSELKKFVGEFWKVLPPPQQTKER